jgi:hypothetical protein
MFAAALWAGCAIRLTCAWSGKWYVVLAGGIVVSITSFAAAIGYVDGVAVSLLLARPRSRKAVDLSPARRGTWSVRRQRSGMSPDGLNLI